MDVTISGKNSRTTIQEIFAARFLIMQLAKRDFSVRYKQTSLGWLWAIINPFVSFVLYAYVFGLLVKVPTPEYNAPFAAVLIVGILFWNFFSSSMTAVSDSLVNNIGLIKKVYFPRAVFGIASVFVSVIDFLIALIFFIPILVYLNVDFDVLKMTIYLPFCALVTLLLSWGIGSWLAILKMKYKDFRHVIPLLLQVLFYASPIVYTASIIPEDYKFVYNLNPLAHIFEMARYATLNSGGLPQLLPTFFGSLFVAILGGLYFVYNERKVVDLE